MNKTGEVWEVSGTVFVPDSVQEIVERTKVVVGRSSLVVVVGQVLEAGLSMEPVLVP